MINHIFFKHLAETFKYPVMAQENGKTGLAKATYSVSEKSEISNVKITEGADTLFDKEVVRVIESLPEQFALLKTKGKADPHVETTVLFMLQSGDSPSTTDIKSDIVGMGYTK